jgi:hypothetical protein
MISMALVDPDFAKSQLKLFLREWYMHPNGQIPAYEWAFGDVNPPVHAWACWRVFQIDRKLTGRPDFAFLETIFHKLLLNFTWWVNRKDSTAATFLKADSSGWIISVSSTAPRPCPPEAYRTIRRHQLDGDVLPQHDEDRDRAVDESRSSIRRRRQQIFEHFLYIAHAMNQWAMADYGMKPTASMTRCICPTAR